MIKLKIKLERGNAMRIIDNDKKEEKEFVPMKLWKRILIGLAIVFAVRFIHMLITGGA